MKPFAKIVIGLILIVGTVSFFIVKEIVNKNPKNLSETIVDNINQHPENWTDSTEYIQEIFPINNFFVNKKCNIIIEIKDYRPSLMLIKPKKLRFNEEESILIQKNIDDAREKNRMKIQEEILKTLCK